MPQTVSSPVEVEVWVPHRISGFFQMMDPTLPTPIDIAKVGSRGGGPALSAFGKTRVIKSSKPLNKLKTNPNYEIFLNGKDVTSDAKTSISVIEQMQTLMPKDAQFIVYHDFDLPIGCGYGSSAAGAIGLAISLNLLYNLGLSSLQTAKFAHLAEVSNNTGLGTVGGMMVGGLSITMDFGFPFIMDQIIVPPNVKVVVGSFGAISTKKILTNPEYKKIIHANGKKAMENIQKNYTVQHYMDTCRQFIDETEMLLRLKLDKVQALIKELYEYPVYGASMNQLGQSVFCFCDNSIAHQIEAVFRKYNPPNVLKILDVCPHGPIVKRIGY